MRSGHHVGGAAYPRSVRGRRRAPVMVASVIAVLSITVRHPQHAAVRRGAASVAVARSLSAPAVSTTSAALLVSLVPPHPQPAAAPTRVSASSPSTDATSTPHAPPVSHDAPASTNPVASAVEQHDAPARSVWQTP